MNYLAHLLLSDPTPGEMLGNLLADFIKGPDLSRFPEPVRHGIAHHRKIDGFTDRHPMVQRSIGHFSKNWGWFSGILVDIYYDHFLAIDFDHYSEVPLQPFVDRVHRMLRDHWEVIPFDAQWAIEKLIETNRLATYATLEGIEDTLYRLSQRIQERMPRKQINLEKSLPEFREHYATLHAEFNEFFPHLVAFSETDPGAAKPNAEKQ
jgi:acyl carrier protein phosphodiesterase